MGIIKLDFKIFIKPTLIYLIVTQGLIYIATTVSDLTITSNSIIIDYFIIFVMALSIVGVVVYTILFSIYFITKSNRIHLDKYQLTDGYGLYRFLTTFAFVLGVGLNIILAMELNGLEVLKMLLELKYYHIAGSIFFLIPLFVLLILSIAHTHKRKIIRNLEAMISLGAIFIGTYIAGNLYYFGNQQQGVAMLFILFIPLAILFTSVKDRNSQNVLYKIIIFILCLLASFISLALVITSDFEYDTSRFGPSGQMYEPELYQAQVDYSMKTIDSKYGTIYEVVDGKAQIEGEIANDQMYGAKLYTLTTDKFVYRLNMYGGSELNLTAYALNGINQYNINDSDYQTEPEIWVEIYEPENDTHYSCSGPVSQIENQDCEIDSEIIEVYTYITENLY